MGLSRFSGPLQSGTQKETRGSRVENLGDVKLVQTAIIGFDDDLVQEAVFNLPEDSEILDVYMDPLTVFNSGTSATGTFGSASAGTQYGGALNVRTANRKRPTFTAAQLTSMENIGTDIEVYATITSVGQPSAGSVRAVVEYVQRQRDRRIQD